MRQFYQHYFTATAKLCWLRWLSVPQRLTMLEELMQWDDRNSLKVDLPASCVTEYWCKITRQQIIPAGFFYSRRAKKGTYDLDNDDGSPYERCLRGIYAGRFYDGGGRGATGSYIELISES